MHVTSELPEHTPPVTVQFGSVLHVHVALGPLPVQLWCGPHTAQLAPQALLLLATHAPPHLL